MKTVLRLFESSQFFLYSTITPMTVDDTVFFVVALKVVCPLRSHTTKHYPFINVELKLATTSITSTICPVH